MKIFSTVVNRTYLFMNMHLQLHIVDKNAFKVRLFLGVETLQFTDTIPSESPEEK